MARSPAKRAPARTKHTLNKSPPAKRAGVDLGALQLAFETTNATLDVLGAAHGCTKGRVSQLAKEHGWKRGRHAEVARARAEEKVQQAEAKAAAGTEAAVDATAQVMADVILSQRARVRKMTDLANRMFGELEGSQDLAEALAKKPQKGKTATVLSDRIDDMRKLGNTVDTLVKLERNVFGITPDTPIDPSRRLEEAVDNGMAGIKAAFAKVLAK